MNDPNDEQFGESLGELVERTGFEIFAWAPMSNHYHLVFTTPEPNLVVGMKWLQNTWTNRFTARHQRKGHLFGA